jgi:hypothetical protein
MNQLEIQREQAAFDEKIALAELEEAKATERVRELKYEKSRFMLNLSVAICKQAQEAQPGSTQQT